MHGRRSSRFVDAKPWSSLSTSDNWMYLATVSYTYVRMCSIERIVYLSPLYQSVSLVHARRLTIEVVYDGPGPTSDRLGGVMTIVETLEAGPRGPDGFMNART